MQSPVRPHLYQSTNVQLGHLVQQLKKLTRLIIFLDVFYEINTSYTYLQLEIILNNETYVDITKTVL